MPAVNMLKIKEYQILTFCRIEKPTPFFCRCAKKYVFGGPGGRSSLQQISLRGKKLRRIVILNGFKNRDILECIRYSGIEKQKKRVLKICLSKRPEGNLGVK